VYWAVGARPWPGGKPQETTCPVLDEDRAERNAGESKNDFLTSGLRSVEFQGLPIPPVATEIFLELGSAYRLLILTWAKVFVFTRVTLVQSVQEVPDGAPQGLGHSSVDFGIGGKVVVDDDRRHGDSCGQGADPARGVEVVEYGIGDVPLGGQCQLRYPSQHVEVQEAFGAFGLQRKDFLGIGAYGMD
jgi:hypothetical protein